MAAHFLFQVFPNSGVPIYRQIVDQVRHHAASGRIDVGDFLPSVRQVAVELEVNPMTVSKAYSLLEREGLVEMVRGQGMRLAPRAPSNGKDTLAERLVQLQPLAQQLAATAYQLSVSPSQVRTLVDRTLKELDRS